ncbi:MAG: DUF4294 domain-containing protein [Bacteroidales bacterium]|nr:DUF4294 domain-containing protein [Bacteroidales bacterium]
MKTVRQHTIIILTMVLSLVTMAVSAQTDSKTTQLLRGKTSVGTTQTHGTPLPGGKLSASPTSKKSSVKKAYEPVPEGGFMCRCIVENGDTFPIYQLPTLYVFKPLVFKNKKQEKFYWRTVRDVKRVLPLSYYIKDLIADTNDTLMTMSTKRERDKYMKAFEKRVYNGNKEEFGKLTLTQGMLLIRMVDRTCNATSYELIRAYLGGFKAGFYQMFAKMLGGDLKASFGSREEDAMVERIILLVESGQL